MKKKAAIIGGTILIVAIIIIVIIINKKPKEQYDVSFMHQVTVKEILDMFSDNQKHFVMVGYSKCEDCLKVLPAIRDSQTKNNYMTAYLDIEKVDRNSSDWLDLVSKLTLKSSQTLTEDGSGEKVTETYGYFLNEYGMTPTIIIINENKQVGGTIGSSDYNTLLNWLTKKANE